MPPHEMLGDLQHVPRVSSKVLRRPALLDLLDGPEALVVLRAPGGTGKTTLMAQWAVTSAPALRGTLMWIEADDGTRTRTGFWLRVLSRFHARELIDDRTLYREMASLADQPDTIADTMRRLLAEHGRPVTLLLDDVGAATAGGYWDEVCADLREVLQRVAMLRIVVAGRRPTLLESASTAAMVDTRVITEAQLALSTEEIGALLDLAVPALAADPRRETVLSQLVAEASTRRLGAVRWALGVLDRALEQESVAPAADGTALDLDALLVDAFREELRSRPADPALQQFLTAIAPSPYVDVDLARQLSGREDAGAMLEALEQLGTGQWLHRPHGAAPLFRLSRHLRLAVYADAPALPAARHREVHALIAHWLAEEHGELIAGIEHALQAADIRHAEQLLMQAYPLSAEDSRHVSALLRTVPAARLHAHPVLALWHALVLNKSADTQSQAVPFFVSAALIGRLRASRTDLREKSVRAGLESAVHRMLGQRRRQKDLALAAVAGLREVIEDPSRDRRYDGVVMTALSQSALSLFYADEIAAARDARALQTRFARDLDAAHQVNVARAHLALLEAVRGDLAASAVALQQIDAAQWPQAWQASYHDSPEIIARAWQAVNEARPAEALDLLEQLDPHLPTIEHWSLITSARCLALALDGRVAEAEALLERTMADRVTSRTLPSSHRRLEMTAGLLRLLAGGVPAASRRSGALKEEPAAAVLAVPRVLAEGREEEAIALLARAELTAEAPLDQLLTVLAAVHLALRGASGLDLAAQARRLTALAEQYELHWPLALLSAADRDALRAALPSTARLEALLARIPAVAPSRAVAPPLQLTARERDVLLLLAETERRSEMAQRLFVSVNTVKVHLRRLYAKLEVTTREEALARALQLGLLQPGDTRADDTSAGDRER